MADLMELIGRLRAHQDGRAICAATHRQVTIAPHALVIAPLAMAGEDTAIHAIAIGKNLNEGFLRQLASENGGEFKRF